MRTNVYGEVRYGKFRSGPVRFGEVLIEVGNETRTKERSKGGR